MPFDTSAFLKRPFVVVFACLGVGCMTSGVAPMGADSYVAKGHSKFMSWDVGGAGAVLNASNQANTFCSKLGKDLIVTSTQVARQGAGANVTMMFRCVGKNSSAPDGKYQKLAELKKLLDDGALTRAEFDREKMKLLGTP